MCILLLLLLCRDPRPRRLLRNISSNSSLANNAHTRDDTAGQDDRMPCQGIASSDMWDTSASMADGTMLSAQNCATFSTSTVSFCTSFDSTSYDSMQPHRLQTPEPAVPVQADPQLLLLGTSSGLFQLDLATQQVQQLALASVPVAFVSYSSCGLVLAACPVEDNATYGSMQSMAAAKEAAGLYCLHLKQHGSCGSTSCFGAAGSSSSAVPAMKLWQGGAT